MKYKIKKKDRPKINLHYFKLLAPIGSGGFSNVILARRKDNGQFYAIKVIDKEEMIRRDKEDIVYNERNINRLLNNPFVVKLHYAFQSVIIIKTY